MIIDTFKNIETYKNISNDIYIGLEYLKNLSPTIDMGMYILSDKVKVFVDEYDTIEEFKNGYESHKNVIDIQYPIIGLEKVKWSPIDNMNVKIAYDSKKDVSYYNKPSKQGIDVVIGKKMFVIMFPHDGHSPQHYIISPERIKKVTLKVSI